MSFTQIFIEKAKKNLKRIAFPEYDDERIIKACKILKEQKICVPVIVGKKIRGFECIIPDNRYEKIFFENRKGKISLKDASLLSKNPAYFATLLLNDNKVDGVVSGAKYTTAETFRPALQIIKTKNNMIASSYFIMEKNEKVLFFADCGLNISPKERELADIAISTADSVKELKIKPKVAMLSFSTKKSAIHPDANKVRDAFEIVKKERPDIIIEGEIQADVALVKEVAIKKTNNSNIQGDANILIFPDLNSGNIAYKLVERLGGYKAIGPISQGLNKPVNDLSRGCSVEDIVILSAITACQSK
ncbi:MAG: phosphate acetyltransferase [Candidatus Woesearchaeota archaeon]